MTRKGCGGVDYTIGRLDLGYSMTAKPERESG